MKTILKKQFNYSWMDHPSFIYQLLNDEIKRIKIKLIEDICEKLKVEDDKKEQLINEFINNIQIIPNAKMKIEVKKKFEPRQPAEIKCRCLGRIWNRGKGGQCTRQKLGDSDYCKQHISNLKHGRIDEPINREQFPKTKAIYKV